MIHWGYLPCVYGSYSNIVIDLTSSHNKLSSMSSVKGEINIYKTKTSSLVWTVSGVYDSRVFVITLQSDSV